MTSPQEQLGKKRKRDDDTDVGNPANAEGRGEHLMMQGELPGNIAEDEIHHVTDGDEDVDDQPGLLDDEIFVEPPVNDPQQGQPNFMEHMERAEQAMEGSITAKKPKPSKHGKDLKSKDNSATHPQFQDEGAEDRVQTDTEMARRVQFELYNDLDGQMADARDELEFEANNVSMQDAQPGTSRSTAGKTKKIPKNIPKKIPKNIPKKVPKRPTASSTARGMTIKRTVEKHVGIDFRSGIPSSCPPIYNIYDVFGDIVKRAMKHHGLEEALKPLLNSGIRIGTMCSGTEAPIFALRMICDVLFQEFGKKLNFSHCYSAEIVPFKQAFIERNFHPKIIYRDIREMGESNDGTAITAYGARAEIPRNVDIVIAGFSCVDFSRMNPNAKKITDIGESGDTFRAILAYAKKNKPAVFIIENIENAPWVQIKTEWEKNTPYKADYIKLDTKHYYLPQTRQRGYMVCCRSDLGVDPVPIIAKWRELMRILHRPTTVSVEAFILPDDDPRLRTVKVDTTKPSTRTRREIDWTICNGRHQDYRAMMALGKRRPITKWIDGGTAKAPDYWWQDWSKAQVERLWDTFEISYLRNALKHFDSFYKVRVWDLSQNIDRFHDSMAHGITGCLTPTGQPFLTTRGGPVTGLESLALQGLPINELILTRETPRQLQDLAGNAMTTTLVGTALVSVFIAAPDLLKAHISQRRLDQSVEMVSLRHREVAPMKAQYLQAYANLFFDATTSTSLHELEEQARNSLRYCYCEGPMEITGYPLLRCRDCGHQSCSKCGVLPRHEYEPIPQDEIARRVSPRDFHLDSRSALPMRIKLTGLSFVHLNGLAFIHLKGLVSCRIKKLDKFGWPIVIEAALSASKGDFRFQDAKVTSCWTFTYVNQNSTLVLVFTRSKTEWQLYGHADEKAEVNSDERKVLKSPIARMVVKGNNLLSGSWEFRVPVKRKMKVVLKGTGEMVPSWKNKLGLIQCANERVFSSLNISFGGERPNIPLDHAIDGDYQLLEDCGTACGSLHKKVQSDDDTGSVPVFLFLDPERVGNPKNDAFVFSTDIHRMAYGELPRHCIAQLDKSWQPTSHGNHRTYCHVDAIWSRCNASLQPFEDSSKPTAYAISVPCPTIPIFGAAKRPSPTIPFDCMDATATFLRFEIKSAMGHTKGWQQSALTVVDPTSEPIFMKQISWLTERAQNLGGFSPSWRAIRITHNIGDCLNCAPPIPTLEWKKTRALKTNKIAPHENISEATRYETAVKSRPSPIRVQYRLAKNGQDSSILEIGLNLPSMCHRALGKLGSTPPNSSGATLSWRLDTHYVEEEEPVPRPFALMNCRGRPESGYDFPARRVHLRPEQKRSLLWMTAQESAKAKAFTRQEIVEATVPNLNWLVEVRATMRQKVLGGVLADEVGYGKTATILALIDCQMKKRETEELKAAKKANLKPKEKKAAPRDYGNLIGLKATLVIVPNTIVVQWQEQVIKFLGSSRKVVAILNLNSLGKMKVEDFEDADIIIVSWEVLRSPAYWKRVALVAGLPEGPTPGGRAFFQWHDLACQRLRAKFGSIQAGRTSMSSLVDELKHDVERAETNQSLLSVAPTKRLTGKKYVQEVERQRDGAMSKATAQIVRPTERAYNHLRVNELRNMKCPCFQMFHFARIVVDEYTYVEPKLYGAIQSIIGDSKWALSGTPPLLTFGDARNVAGITGANLGSSDERKSMQDDRTDAEMFRSLVQANTAAWHKARLDHAQEYMTQYVRQDRAEYDEIPTAYHTMIVEQHVVEKSCGKELLSALQANGWKIVHRSAKGNLGDRDRSLNAFLLSSKSAEEAILKSVAHFEGGRGISTTDQFKFLVTRREGELTPIVKSITNGIRHAEWLKKQLSRSLIHDLKDEKYRSYMAAIERREFASAEVILLLHELIDIANEKVVQKDRSRFYRRKVSKAALKDEEKLRRAATKANVPDPTDNRPFKIRWDDYPKFLTQLRVVSAQLRRDTNELVNRTRSKNFLENISKCAEKQICGVEGCKTISNLSINVLCGHVTCQKCTKRSQYVEHCLHELCDTSTEEYRMMRIESARVSIASQSRFGGKLDAIVKLIKFGIPRDDQVLIFVQFDDLMLNVEDAFDKSKISCWAITSKVKSKDASAMIQDFQKQRSPSKRKKVLLLNSANETAAGANLVNANHVIFLCPLLTEDIYRYIASRKQAIGRARRYGQTKQVHVYDYLALESFDIDLFQQREGVKLVNRREGGGRTWQMVKPEDVRKDEQQQQWGTGHTLRQ